MTAVKKVVFLGSKPIGYQCFEHLIQMQKEYGYEIVRLLSRLNKNFDLSSDLSALAKIHQVPVLSSLEELKTLTDIDILISVQYHQILKQEHIDVAREIAVNLHMAPLPEYRGCNQFSWAIINNDKVFGTTLHKMETGIDSGAIIDEERFDFSEGIDVTKLYDLTFENSVKLFKRALPSLIKGDYTLTDQSELKGSRSESIHYRKEIQELKSIDLSLSPEEIERRVRGTSMPGFEPPSALVDGRKIYMMTEKLYKSLSKD